jgi:hypothetical protein
MTSSSLTAAAPRVFNSAALVDASGLRCVYRKEDLWDAEPRWFAAGVLSDRRPELYERVSRA